MRVDRDEFAVEIQIGSTTFGRFRVRISHADRDRFDLYLMHGLL